MIKIKKVLFPTDFSELALHAYPYARTFAGDYNADLHVLHVVDDAYQYWMAMGPDAVPVGPSVDEMMDNGREQMESFVAENLSDFQQLVSKVTIGRPFLEIIRYAREESMDLIVVGTHGRGGLGHVLLGSTTEKIVRKAHCPVLTIRDPAHKFEMP